MKLRDQVAAGYRYWRADRHHGLPLQVGLAVNNTCNTFCDMCNIWKMKPKQDLGLDEIRRIFSGPLFAECVTVSLTGGEPTMRKDFGQIPVLLAEVMPRLARVALTTNGYATDRIVEQFREFLPALAERDVAFSVNISMDGVGDVHNRVRNNKRAWGHLVDTLDELAVLREHHRFNLVLACTLSRGNAEDAPNVLEFARQRGLYVIFRNAFTVSRIGNLMDFESFSATPAQLAELMTFYDETLAAYDRSHARSTYYSMLVRMMQGGDRDIPCLYRKAGLFIDHLADMYVCTVFSERLGNAIADDPLEVYERSYEHRSELADGPCRRCSHDVTLYLPVLSQGWDRTKSAVTKVRR